MEEEQLIDFRLAPELLATELREFPLPEPHTDRVLIELNPAKGDGDERKDHATRSLEVTNHVGGIISGEETVSDTEGVDPTASGRIGTGSRALIRDEPFIQYVHAFVERAPIIQSRQGLEALA